MRTIHKYPLAVGHMDIAMPQGAKVLAVQMQGETPCAWALVETDNAVEWRSFDTYGTGHPMPKEPGSYVATFQMANDWGNLVWHVFETKAKE